jgi:hypothetical protein
MSGLTILNATYGSGSASKDVTKEVSELVRDGILNLSVSTHSLNVEDPAPGQIKTLKISYSINGGTTNTIEILKESIIEQLKKGEKISDIIFSEIECNSF